MIFRRNGWRREQQTKHMCVQSNLLCIAIATNRYYSVNFVLISIVQNQMMVRASASIIIIHESWFMDSCRVFLFSFRFQAVDETVEQVKMRIKSVRNDRDRSRMQLHFKYKQTLDWRLAKWQRNFFLCLNKYGQSKLAAAAKCSVYRR